ncbi:MAG: nucleoside triphosphate pyrophosphohydrolase family protein [Candidatus Moraniibacteriota bacterium]
MEFDEYQKLARKTAMYPEIGKPFVYPTLGLVGEAGEVAEKVKKIMRNDKGVVSEEVRQDIKKELGDVLWYLAQVAHEFGFTLDEVAEKNIEKLADRLDRGVIHSSGDNR